MRKIILFLLFSFTLSSSAPVTRITYNVCGDSIGAGYYAYNGTTGGISYGWAYLLGNLKNAYVNNISVSGQTVSQGTDVPFTYSLTPSKAISGDKIIGSWGVNDCWKATNLKLDSALHAWFEYCVNVKNWARGDIIYITGYPVDAGGCPPYFTKAHYDSVCTYVIIPRCVTDNITYIDLRNSSITGTSTYLYDCIHLNTLGHRYAADYLHLQSCFTQ